MRARRSRSPRGARGAPSVAGRPAPAPDFVSARPAWLQHAAAIVLLGFALGCVLPEIAWQQKIFAAPDFESPSYFAAAGRRALAAGEYPQWNPYIFLGMPSFASLMFNPYVFPPSAILAFLGRLPFAPPLAWLLFYFVAAGYGVFVLLHSLRCGFWPALAAGAAYMLMPHLVSMGVFGHGSKLASAALLPWLLWAALQLRYGTRRLSWSALLGLMLGLLLLRGHPQIAFYGLLMLATFGLVEAVVAARGRGSRGDFVRFAAGMGGGLLLGFGLAAVLLLPVRAYAPSSIRGASEGGGASYQYATNWSLSPSEVATFVLPSARGFGEGTYVGAMPFTNFPHYLGQAVLLFGVAALLLLRGRLLGFLVTLALLSLFVSFGKHASFVYDLFYDHLPYFNKFRVPVMILILLQLASCVAAGLGLAALWGRKPSHLEWRALPDARTASRILAATAVAGLFLLGVSFPWSAALADRVAQSTRLPAGARDAYAEVARGLLRGDGARVAFLLVAHAGVVAALWRGKLRADAAGALLLVLGVVDLGFVDRRMVQPQKTWPGLASRVTVPRTRQPQPGPLVRFIQERAGDSVVPPRVFPLGERPFMDNEWMAHGVASAGGYHPAKLVRYQELLDAAAPIPSRRIMDLLAVRYIITSRRLEPGVEPVYEGRDGVVYENPTALARAWVTGRFRLASPNDCTGVLVGPDLELDREVLLEEPPERQLDAAAAGSARIIGFTANRVEVEVTSSAAALLVLSEAYHPNWKATVDGEERLVRPADCVLRCVEVPGGTSHVVFEFADPALRAGLGITSGSALVIALLLVLGARRGRGPGAEAAAPGEVPAS